MFGMTRRCATIIEKLADDYFRSPEGALGRSLRGMRS